MATTTTTSIIQTDDFTGEATEDVTNVRFAMNGVEYEIDLNAKNKHTLESHVQQFIDRARKVTGKKSKGAAAPRDRGEASKIRAWAKDNYDGINQRGRMSAEIVAAYHARKAA